MNHITKELPCRLTQDELLQAAKDAQEAHRRIVEIEDRKRAITAQLKGEAEEQAGIMSQAFAKISSECEYRPVECEEHIDYDLVTMAVVRTDTGEVVSSRPLTVAERQTEIEQEGVNNVGR